jgi:hypothetical protein
MPPIQTNVEPSEELWFALRQKHYAELYDFQQKSKQAYERVQQNIKKAEADLFAKHKKEEEEFWTKARAASKDKSKSANRSAASKTGTQGRNNRKGTEEAGPATNCERPDIGIPKERYYRDSCKARACYSVCESRVVWQKRKTGNFANSEDI